MADGISMDGGGARPAIGAGDIVRVADRAVQPVEAKAAEPAPARRAVRAPADAIALGQARDRIAAVLAAVDTRPATVMPLSPDAGEEAIAAAQALAELIAANAHPTLAAQAHLGPEAVRMAIAPPPAALR